MATDPNQAEANSPYAWRQGTSIPGYVGGETNIMTGEVRGGHPGEAQMAQDREAAGVYTNNAVQLAAMNQQNISPALDPRAQALQDAQKRAGYAQTLGDTRTQAILRATAAARMMGLDVANQDVMTGRILETQRQAAYLTPSLRDDRFFSGELQKWGENAVEIGSAYHAFGMRGEVPIAANPFEFRADLAIEFLKGAPGKGSEWFSPVSGQMSTFLPGGKGVQQLAWGSAVAFDKNRIQPAPVSFMPAVGALNRAEGLMGPYGMLAGGKRDTRSIFDVPASTTPTLPTPFISRIDSIVTSPASPIINIFGLKINAGPVGKFFNPAVTTVTTRGSPVQVDMMKMGGATFTNKFIVGGKPSESMTYPVGAPVVVGDISTQMYETVKLSNVGTVIPITSISTEGLSAFGKLNKDISDKYIKPFTPTSEQAKMSGYAFFRAGNIVEGKGRVITPADVANFEKNKPIESAIVGYFAEGFYGGAREAPVTFGVSYAAGAVVGGLWRGVEGVSALTMPTIARNAPTIARTLQLGGKALPYVFGAVVVGETAYRSTEGFSNFESRAVAVKLGKITSTEIMPGFAGFGTGYRATSGAIDTAKLTRLDYLSMQQEAKAQNLANIPTTGRAGLGEIKYNVADYAAFKIQKFGMETQGRVSIFGENVLTVYTRAKVTGIPDMQIAMENAIYGGYGRAYQALGYGKYSPADIKLPEIPGTSVPTVRDIIPTTRAPAASRMGTKTVGGKTVSSLAREPSLKSMGAAERILPAEASGSKSFASSRSVDFRGQQSSTMKPMEESSYGYQGKQASGQIQIFSEQLPMVEGMTQGRVVSPQLISPKSGLVSVQMQESVVQVRNIIPAVMIGGMRLQTSSLQKQISDSMVVSMQRTGVYQQQGIESMQEQMKRSIPVFSIRVGKLAGQLSGQLSGQTQERGTLLNTAISQAQKNRQENIVSPMSDVSQMFKTDQLQRQIQKPEFQPQIEPIIRPKPIITTFPGLPGAGGGGPFGLRGEGKWQYRNPVATDIIGKSKGALRPLKMKMKMMKPFKGR